MKGATSSFQSLSPKMTALLVKKDMVISFTVPPRLPWVSEIIPLFYHIIFRKGSTLLKKVDGGLCLEGSALPVTFVYLRCLVAHFKILVENFSTMFPMPIGSNSKTYLLKVIPSEYDMEVFLIDLESGFQILIKIFNLS